MKQKISTFLVWCLLVLLFCCLFYLSAEPKKSFIEYSNFQEYVAGGLVQEVRVNNNEIRFKINGRGTTYVTLGVVDDELTRNLSERGVVMQWGEEENVWRSVLIYGFPILLLLGLFIYFAKRQAGGQGGIFALKKSRARLITDETAATFDKVGGSVEAKEQLSDVIDFLTAPERWAKAGARLPRGILLEGAPGCGKTLLARAVAGETKATFYTVSASEFVEMFVGVGAARVRDMFEEARKTAPAVIFIDELDAVGRRRGSGIGAGHDEREQTLNQLLVCLDGFEKNERVVVIGATNRSDILDKALLRPGRFDRRIKIGSPDREAREEIFKIHLANKKTADDVSIEHLAERTEGWVGASIESLCNEAALRAVRRARQNDEQEAELTREDFSTAVEEAELQRKIFNALDLVLIESATQLAEPTARAVVSLELEGGIKLEGEVIWADAAFVKLRQNREEGELLIPKIKIVHVEALAGTEQVDSADVQSDPWAARMPDMA